MSKPARTRLHVPSPTLLQLMKLVVFAAVTSSCVAFGAQVANEIHLTNVWPVVCVEGIFIPLMLILVAFPLLKRGQLKDWLILALLATSISFAWGIVIAIAILLMVDQMTVRRQSPELAVLLFPAIASVVLVMLLFYLFQGLVPGRCPDCRRRTLLPEAKFRLRAETRKRRAYQCLGCRVRFWKPFGFWEAIPTDPQPLKS